MGHPPQDKPAMHFNGMPIYTDDRLKPGGWMIIPLRQPNETLAEYMARWVASITEVDIYSRPPKHISRP